MAVVTVPNQGQRVTGEKEVAKFLQQYGIRYERWPLEERCNPDATNEEILAAYAPEIERLKAEGGYVTADVINVTPETPNLDAMINKFNKEHTHDEDEVRFIVKGRGLFHIHPPEGEVFSIEMVAGDWISVPKGTRHWFDFCQERTIRAIRLFQDTSGWTPHYVEEGVHDAYLPVCWGPSFLPPATRIEPAVKL
ncbi:MAG TPA: cupin domain-containing protein [Gemmatales bacterium]|nr:cupin domain-containing protein [Gemmatales bacterium]